MQNFDPISANLSILKTNSGNADFAALVKLLDQDLLNRYGEKQSFFDQFNKTDHINHVVVAYVDNVAAGCGAMKEHSANCTEIKRMFVKPAYRGKGIAQKLLTALEAWALELNYQNCILETGKGQPEAIQLYQKLGYVVVQNYGQYVGVEQSVCMEKEISVQRL